MITFTELFISFVIAILFVLLFKLQKIIMPQSYFASSQLIVKSDVSWRMIIIRILLVFFFGLFTYLIIREIPVILIGTLLGSFLIVWPVFLSPTDVYYMFTTRKQIFSLYLSHIIFIVSSFSIVFLSIKLFPVLSDFAISKLDDLPGNILIWLTITVFGYPLQGKVHSCLGKSVSKSNTNDYSDEVYSDEVYSDEVYSDEVYSDED